MTDSCLFEFKWNSTRRNPKKKKNIVDIEWVNREHPKATSKLSNPIKQLYNKYKIKDYWESKAIYCEQKLEIIKRHNYLPQNCSQLYEIKIFNFKEQDLVLKANYLKQLKNLNILNSIKT